MKNRGLTLLVAALFTCHAVGLAGAVHWALEHSTGHPAGHSHHGEHAGANADVPCATAAAHEHGLHGPAHCPFCQMLAAWRALPTPAAYVGQWFAPRPDGVVLIPSHLLSSVQPTSLQPRAPPSGIGC